MKYEVQLNQAPSTFYVVYTASEELVLHEGNMKFNTQHEELVLFSTTLQALVGQGLQRRGKEDSHTNTPHLVELPWKSDQLDEETCT